MFKKPLKIKYFDVWGLREDKYDFLESHDVKNTDWREIELKEPYFWFVPKDARGEGVYQKFVSVKDIFEKYNAGIATGKDEVLVDFNKESLIRKLSIKDKISFESLMETYKVDKKLIDDWYKELNDKNISEQIKDYNYRIFDKRFVIYNNKILQRGRDVLMRHLLKNNLSLIITKILSSEKYKHVFISDAIGDRCFISNRGKEANYFFPLYLYKPIVSKPVFKSQRHLDLAGVQKEIDEYEENRKSNIKTEIIKKLSELYQKDINPEEIFYYIYAILYSNIYRQKYNEFLKIDFPRVPFAKDVKLFDELAKLGEELVNLHLLKLEKLKNISAKFPIVGDNRARKREYNKKENRLYINDEQYFENIEPEIYNYYIGGYQVLDKWLKDRKDKVLSVEDVNHFLRIITALKLTIQIQKEIDKLYPGAEKNLK